MMHRILIIGFLFISIMSFGQSGVQTLLNARSIAMGGTQTLNKGGQALFGNVAGLAFAEHIQVLATAENKFLVSELQNAGLGVLLPTQSGNFGIEIARFGFEDYNELQLALGFARKLSDNISIGGEIIYWNNNIPEYGSRSFLTFALGIQTQLSQQISLGAHVYNPLRTEVTAEENTYSILQIGLAYRASDQLTIVAEVEKDIDFPARFKAGIDYAISDVFQLRMGVGTKPTLFAFGIGVQLSPNIRLDFAANRHEVLGFSPGATFVYLASGKQSQEEDKSNSTDFF